MSKTPEDALELFKEMENTQSLWANKRAIPKKGVAIEIDVLTMVRCLNLRGNILIILHCLLLLI